MFPTIFTLGIAELGEAKPQGSGVLCTAIVGGAVIPPAFGALVDASGFGLALAASRALLRIHRRIRIPHFTDGTAEDILRVVTVDNGLGKFHN